MLSTLLYYVFCRVFVLRLQQTFACNINYSGVVFFLSVRVGMRALPAVRTQFVTLAGIIGDSVVKNLGLRCRIKYASAIQLQIDFYFDLW